MLHQSEDNHAGEIRGRRILNSSSRNDVSEDSAELVQGSGFQGVGILWFQGFGVLDFRFVLAISSPILNTSWLLGAGGVFIGLGLTRHVWL